MAGNLSLRELRKSANTSTYRTQGSFFASKRNHSTADSSFSYNPSLQHNESLANQSTIVHSSDITGANTGLAHDSGIVELTKNTMFRVSRLAATPAILQPQPEANQSATSIKNGSFDPINNQALLLSNRMAYIWSYNSPDKTPECLSFPVGENNYNDQSNPFGIFVSPAAGSTESGLVTVTSSGALNYWESTGGVLISEDMLQKRKNLDHQISLYNGEGIENLQNIEPAGIIATTSSGRYILVTLRDSSGKTHITSTTMRGNGPGFWNNIRGALAVSTTRKNVVAIKLGISTHRNHRQVLIVNRDAALTIWDCDRNTDPVLKSDLQLKSLMLNYIKDIYPQAERGFQTHDMELLHNGFLVFLTSFALNDSEECYILFSVDVTNENPHLVSTYRVQSYSKRSTAKSPTPKLLLPQPGDTLFLVFPSAVVLVDTIKKSVSENPSSLLDKKWEDIVTFRDDVQILTSGYENMVKVNEKVTVHAGIVVSTNNSGIIRFERFERANDLAMADYKVSEYDLAKTRVEQAIHFGGDEENPIVFDLRKELKIHPREIELALISVSKDILNSSSPYLPPHLPSITEYLELRCERLDRLAFYVNRNLSNGVSVQIRLQLLWHLEMAVAARSLWSLIDPYSIESVESPQSVLLTIIAQHIQDLKIPDTDPLRAWFLNHLDDFMPLLLDAQKYCASQSVTGPSNKVIWDTNRVLLTVLNESAYKTREAYSSDIYGISELGSCEQPPWTSSKDLMYALEDQYTLTCNAMTQISATNDDLYDELKYQMLDLVAVLYYTYEERMNWCRGQDPTGLEINSLSACLNTKGSGWLRSFVDVDERERALNIAEVYHVYSSMVEILDGHYTQIIQGRMKDADKDSSIFEIRNAFLGYFETFGYPFAVEVYYYFANKKQFNILLAKFPEFNQYLERFFEEGNLPKLAWVQDIHTGNNQAAGVKLTELTFVKDPPVNVSNKLIQLSIAKLALLSTSQDDLSLVDEIDRQLELSTVQKSLFDQFKGYMPERDDGSVDVFIEEISPEFKRRNMPYIEAGFKRALGKLATEVALNSDELIDILTLTNLKSKSTAVNFFEALRIVASSNENNKKKKFLQQLIWRRAFLCDDWNTILATKGKSDDKMTEITSQTILFKTILAGLSENLFDVYLLELPRFSSSLISEQDKPLIQEHFTDVTESEINGIYSDLVGENILLQASCDKVDLEGWTKGLVVMAKRMVGQEPTFNSYSNIRSQTSTSEDIEMSDI
ncbi:hypothetical protein NADFUDRAFT_52601 [Nadsonia fulvescens var. elongata DSM 6958]|uniref:Nucleoporin-domain-containing protein n=1 Tax=Nadsonia fulvescens var. elongata DSM 6958 TaxID=857566 RepID=A0A1E3PG28_9ASCO|nr:hypothetical protein NADFUDRAFT_52601 [Nadsonia fulvescens var. elongata DSM 6958]